MKIAFTGGVTGGHFYPHIAVAEELRCIAAENHLLDPTLYYLAPTPFDEKALFENNIQYVRIPAGKTRRYFSLENFTGIFTTLYGTLRAFFTLFRMVPDVIFSKGGFGSVPVVLAARLMRIPVVAHESDSKPGRATLLAAKSAERIAITFDSSIQYFPKKVQGKIARTGIPVRARLMEPYAEGAAEKLSLDPTAPTVLILGGSSGSTRINEIILAALSDLVQYANLIHQTGKENFEDVSARSRVILKNVAEVARYRAFPYLTQESLRRAYTVADVIVSRAGATAITEISLAKKPAILIPIPEAVSHDQKTNAYSYARTGAAVVLEEENMTPHILVSEIRRITSNPEVAERMRQSAEGFANPHAARIIAEELIRIAHSHSNPL